MNNNEVSDKLNELVECFLNESNFSDSTVEIYRTNLHKYLRTLPLVCKIEYTEEIIFDCRVFKTTLWQYGLRLSRKSRNRNRSENSIRSTLNIYISTWNSFIRFCAIKQGRDNYKKVKVFKRHLGIIPQVDLKLMASQMCIDFSNSSWKILQRQAIFELLAFYGLRVSEIQNLKCQDADLQHARLFVQNGFCSRTIFLDKVLADCIGKFLALTKHFNSRSSHLFIAIQNNSRMVSTFWIYKSTCAMSCKLTGGMRIPPQTLRQICGLYYYTKTNDMFFVKALLGYSTIDFMRKYTLSDLDGLVRCMQLHPRFKRISR